MKIKFKNANILQRDFTILISYDLVVENDLIKSITPTNDDDDIFYDRVIDCNHNYLIPGFKNAHSHNAMVFVRSLTDDLPLNEWLTEKIFPLEALLTEEDVYYFTILGIMESLTSGITSAMDMYKYNYTMADAYVDTGFRARIVDAIMFFDKVIKPEEYFNNIGNHKGDNGNIVKFIYGIHAEYTNNEDTMKMMSELVHKYKAPLFSHNSETKKEVNECKERWGGLTPTEVHEKFGLYDYGGGGYHCIYLSDNDMEIFKKHNLYLVANAGSNLKLASGVAPFKKYLNNGIKVAIGTDGPSSNNAIDMFREMYLVSNLSKYIEEDPGAISTSDIVNMAVCNSANCMGLENCDALEVGKKADLVLIDVKKPNMQPENTFVNNLVYACGKQNVKLTMIDGKIKYEDGRFFINYDEGFIYRKCNYLLKKLLERAKN